MIEFEIAELPPMLLNSRMHFRAKYTKQMYWYGRVLMALAKVGAVGVSVSPAQATYTRCAGSRLPDFDNLVSSFKWIQDAVVLAGVLDDDAPYHINPQFRWEKASPKKGLIRIQISSMKDKPQPEDRTLRQ